MHCSLSSMIFAWTSQPMLRTRLSRSGDFVAMSCVAFSTHTFDCCLNACSPRSFAYRSSSRCSHRPGLRDVFFGMRYGVILIETSIPTAASGVVSCSLNWLTVVCNTSPCHPDSGSLKSCIVLQGSRGRKTQVAGLLHFLISCCGLRLLLEAPPDHSRMTSPLAFR